MKDIYKHVFVQSAKQATVMIIFELRMMHYQVIFNASSLPYYLPNADDCVS